MKTDRDQPPHSATARSRELLTRLRADLRRSADASKAPGMRAYMKSAMPYHGVPLPTVRKVCRRVFADLDLPTAAAWRSHALTLWRKARYREERYAALALAGHPRAARFQTPDAMKMYEEMITTGAWWDYVDDIATHRVGPILMRHRKPMETMMRAWSRSENLWKRRTSILCQIGFKQETDLDLLYACIEPSLGSKEFFLQKAVGWALRQYAWTDPEEVIRYVRRHDARLSPLSRREALKNVLKR